MELSDEGTFFIGGSADRSVSLWSVNQVHWHSARRKTVDLFSHGDWAQWHHSLPVCFVDNQRIFSVVETTSRPRRSNVYSFNAANYLQFHKNSLNVFFLLNLELNWRMLCWFIRTPFGAFLFEPETYNAGTIIDTVRTESCAYYLTSVKLLPKCLVIK